MTSFKVKTKPLTWIEYFVILFVAQNIGFTIAWAVVPGVVGVILVGVILTVLFFVLIVVLKMIFRPMALSVGVQGSTYDPDFQFTLRSKKDSADIENAIRRQQAAVGETW